MDLKLTGKIALVTGSSRGIGLATAKAFAAEGCQVMLSGRSTEQLRETETALRATGAQVAAHAGDVLGNLVMALLAQPRDDVRIVLPGCHQPALAIAGGHVADDLLHPLGAAICGVPQAISVPSASMGR
jgi:NAD(P)-dependent dehydrogenase (short-subunit alcohol dehydrogenase family)